MSASRHFSTRSLRPQRRKPPTILSARSSPMSATSRCLIERLETLAAIAVVERHRADAAHLRRHRRPRPRRVEGRGTGQPVFGQHPRVRRHRPCGALFRGRRRHPCRGQESIRSGRYRDDRDRADAGRPRKPGAADDRDGEEARRAATRKPKKCYELDARAALVRIASRQAGPAGRGEAGRARRKSVLQSLGLLSSKPVLYVCNVEEASADGWKCVFRRKKSSVRAKSRRRRGGRRLRARSRAKSRFCRREEQSRVILRLSASQEPGLNRVIRAGYRPACIS